MGSTTMPDGTAAADMLAWRTRLTPVLIFMVLLVAINAALAIPSYGTAMSQNVILAAPGIIPFALTIFVILSGSRRIASVGAVILALIALLIAVDISYSAFYGRPLNIMTDAQVLPRSLSTMLRAFPWQTTGLLAAIIVGFCAAFYLARWMFFSALRLHQPVALVCIATLALMMACASMLWSGPALQSRVTGTVAAQIKGALVHREATRGIRTALATNPLRDAGGIAALSGANVHLLFVESYGTVALDSPGILNGLEARLAGAGYSTASHTLDAPITGGRSWLSHGTVLSGATLHNDSYSPLLHDSDRATLVDLFGKQGYRAVAIGPAVRRPWTENGFFRFDEVLTFHDLDYRGPRFGPLDIPDQVTLKRIDDLVLKETDADTPVFLVAALLSSHWPWTGTPPRLPAWDAIDRGQSLAPLPPPVSASENNGSLPPLYLDSLRYSLDSVVDYAVNAVAGNDLLIVVGDHPPAAFATGNPHDRSVPIHVLSREAGHLGRFLKAGFVPGMEPQKGTTGAAMEDLARWLTGQAIDRDQSSAISTAFSGVSATE